MDLLLGVDWDLWTLPDDDDFCFCLLFSDPDSQDEKEELAASPALLPLMIVEFIKVDEAEEDKEALLKSRFRPEI